MSSTRTPKPEEHGAATVSALVAVVILGCALRLTGLDVHSLWFDELATIQIASSSDVLRALELDRHPPLSFLAFRAWSEAFGSDAATLRLLPAVVSCIALALFAGVARSVLRPLAGLAATALFAVAPFHVWIAQEVRMYAFLELAAVLVLGAVRIESARRRLPLLVASCALAVGTHYMGVLVVATAAGVAVAQVLAHRSPPRRAAADTVAAALGALLWTPWILRMVPGQMQSDWGYQARLAPRDLIELPVRQVLTELDVVPAALAPVGYAVSAVLLLGLATSLVRAAVRREEADLFAAAAWVAPVAAAAALTLFLPPNFTPRYLTAASPGVALAIAVGLASIPWSAVRGIGLAGVLLGALGLTYLHRQGNQREDFRTACAEIRAQWRPGDAILGVTGTPGATPRLAFDHYFRDDAALLASCLTWEDVADPAQRRSIAGRLHVVVREAHYTRDRLAALRDGFEVLDESPWREGVLRLRLQPRP